jgi:CHASE2 domain-containing sensor protein
MLIPPLLDAAWQRLGRLPAARVTWTLAAIFSLWAVLDVMMLQLSSGMALSTYDAMVRLRFHAAAPDPRIVVVDIDEPSLARMAGEFGRWPWPRDTLATVLAHIERQQPAAVVWDVLFADADLHNPGGDAAFDAAAALSTHSHFPVVRLPAANDAQSRVTHAQLPGLWAKPLTRGAAGGSTPATLALIPPVLPAVAAGRLGYNNGYVDGDGVLRRYRYAQVLGDGSVIQSLPLSVLGAIDLEAHTARLASAERLFDQKNSGELIAWRPVANAYPRVAFADVFVQAEGGEPLGLVPGFANKVVIIGATAPSLHDIHPTPLSPYHAGVDSLATALDNGLNQRQLMELPRWLQAVLACALSVGIGLWASWRGVSSLAPVLLVLPAGLLLVSYLTLNLTPVFVDLHLAAGLALLFLAVLRQWNSLRRDCWCRMPAAPPGEPLLAWLVLAPLPWTGVRFDRLLDAVQAGAPESRVVAVDAMAVWPSRLSWPDLVRVVAVVGPESTLTRALPGLQVRLQPLLDPAISPVVLPVSPEALMPILFKGWATLLAAEAQS